MLHGQQRAGGLGGLDDVLQLRIAGQQLRRKVVVEVQVELADDAAGGAGRFGERLQFGSRVEIVVAFLRSLTPLPLCRVAAM